MLQVAGFRLALWKEHLGGAVAPEFQVGSSSRGVGGCASQAQSECASAVSPQARAIPLHGTPSETSSSLACAHPLPSHTPPPPTPTPHPPTPLPPPPAHLQTPSSLACARYVRSMGDAAWQAFVAEEPAPLPCHLMTYPVAVAPDGEVRRPRCSPSPVDPLPCAQSPSTSAPPAWPPALPAWAPAADFSSLLCLTPPPPPGAGARVRR